MTIWTRILRAVLLMAGAGVLSVVIGEALPRRWFDPQKPFWRGYAWERGGRIYRRLGVQVWKDRMPDVSRALPSAVKKKAALTRTADGMERLVRETCEAEFIHWALILLVSPLLPVLCGGAVGGIAAALYAAGNLVFVVIQRYNRPRLALLLEKMKLREQRVK